MGIVEALRKEAQGNIEKAQKLAEEAEHENELAAKLNKIADELEQADA